MVKEASRQRREGRRNLGVSWERQSADWRFWFAGKYAEKQLIRIERRYLFSASYAGL
jgi:hypothetical protein